MKIVFVVVAAALFAFANIPSVPDHLLGWDKLDHMAAFLVLTIMIRIAWPRLGVGAIFVGLALFGGAIELAQWQMGLGRDGDVMDWIADLIAIVVGLGVGEAFRRAIAGMVKSRADSPS